MTTLRSRCQDEQPHPNGCANNSKQMARRDWHRDGPDVRLKRSRTCISIPIRRWSSEHRSDHLALERADIPYPTPPGMPSAPALTVVLLGLANHASRHGADAYPSVRTLAGYARISERQVQRCLKALAALGLIAKGDQERIAATIPREDRRPVLYNLSIKRGDTSSPRSSERGDKTKRRGVTGTTDRGDTPVTRTVLEPRDEPAALPHPTKRTHDATCEQQPFPIDRLATACRRAGLSARFDTLTPAKRTLVEQSIDTHGVDALVRAALERHRPWDQLAPQRPGSRSGSRCNHPVRNSRHDAVGAMSTAGCPTTNSDVQCGVHAAKWRRTGLPLLPGRRCPWQRERACRRRRCIGAVVAS